jgi:peptide/nickel transport system permease protein
MLRYAARRLLSTVVLLLVVSMIIFALLRVIPGDPTLARAGQFQITGSQLAALRHEFGLDKPVLTQYAIWLKNALTGDLGASYFTGSSTVSLIGQRFTPTLELMILTLVVTILVGFGGGIATALWPNRIVDRLLSGFAAVGMAVPAFALGLMLLLLFSVRLGWFPTRGYIPFVDDPLENLHRAVLPALTMGLIMGAQVIRFLRTALREQFDLEYIRTARGKGLLWPQVVWRHALPNGLLPTVTFLGVVVGYLLGGVVVVEWVFGWPGLGALAIDAVFKRDYLVLEGLVLLGAVVFVVTASLVDIATHWLDPRFEGG